MGTRDQPAQTGHLPLPSGANTGPGGGVCLSLKLSVSFAYWVATSPKIVGIQVSENAASPPWIWRVAKGSLQPWQKDWGDRKAVKTLFHQQNGPKAYIASEEQQHIILGQQLTASRMTLSVSSFVCSDRIFPLSSPSLPSLSFSPTVLSNFRFQELPQKRHSPKTTIAQTFIASVEKKLLKYKYIQKTEHCNLDSNQNQHYHRPTGVHHHLINQSCLFWAPPCNIQRSPTTIVRKNSNLKSSKMLVGKDIIHRVHTTFMSCEFGLLSGNYPQQHLFPRGSLVLPVVSLFSGETLVFLSIPFFCIGKWKTLKSVF